MIAHINAWLAYFAAHWTAVTTVAGAAWTFVSVVNGLIKNPEANNLFEDFLDVLSYIKRANAPGSLKFPFQRSVPRSKAAAPPTTESKTPSKGSTVAKALVPFLLIGSLLLSSCACWQPSSPEYNDTKCVIARQVVSCIGTVAGSIGQVVGQVISQGLLAGQSTNVDQIVQTAEADAPGAGICVLASAETDIPASPTTAQLSTNVVALRQLVHVKALALATKLYGKKNISVKVKKADGTVAVVLLTEVQS
jgi:hypothetical protein